MRRFTLPVRGQEGGENVGKIAVIVPLDIVDFPGVTKNGDPYWVTKLTKAGEAIYVGPRSQAEKDNIQDSSFNYFYDNKYTIANNLTLYPVIAYNTLCYVKDGGKWKLALPYVKDGGKWKLALMYGKDGGKWKL